MIALEQTIIEMKTDLDELTSLAYIPLWVCVENCPGCSAGVGPSSVGLFDEPRLPDGTGTVVWAQCPGRFGADDCGRRCAVKTSKKNGDEFAVCDACGFFWIKDIHRRINDFQERERQKRSREQDESRAAQRDTWEREREGAAAEHAYQRSRGRLRSGF